MKFIKCEECKREWCVQDNVKYSMCICGELNGVEDDDGEKQLC